MKVYEALNLYSLHSKPETLKGHHKMQELLAKPNKWVCLNGIKGKAYSFETGETLTDMLGTLYIEHATYIPNVSRYDPGTPLLFIPHVDKKYGQIKEKYTSKFKQMLSTMDCKSWFYMVNSNVDTKSVVVSEAPLDILSLVVKEKY